MKYFIFSLFFIFASAPLEAMTVASLRTEVRRTMRDDSSNTEDQRYSDAAILSLINEAQREVINLTWLSQKTTAYILAPRTTYYALPQDALAVREVKFFRTPANAFNLSATTIDDLRRTNPAYEAISGAPVSYWVEQATFSAVGSTSALRIAYLPIPTNLSTGTVTVLYFNSVDDLARDTDIPFNGKTNLFTYHMGIVYYVIARLKTIEGVTDEATIYMTMFNNYLKMVQGRTGAVPGYNPVFNDIK